MGNSQLLHRTDSTIGAVVEAKIAGNTGARTEKQGGKPAFDRFPARFVSTAGHQQPELGLTRSTALLWRLLQGLEHAKRHLQGLLASNRAVWVEAAVPDPIDDVLALHEGDRVLCPAGDGTVIRKTNRPCGRNFPAQDGVNPGQHGGGLFPVHDAVGIERGLTGAVHNPQVVRLPDLFVPVRFLIILVHGFSCKILEVIVALIEIRNRLPAHDVVELHSDGGKLRTRHGCGKIHAGQQAGTQAVLPPSETK